MEEMLAAYTSKSAKTKCFLDENHGLTRSTECCDKMSDHTALQNVRHLNEINHMLRASSFTLCFFPPR